MNMEFMQFKFFKQRPNNFMKLLAWCRVSYVGSFKTVRAVVVCRTVDNHVDSFKVVDITDIINYYNKQKNNY